MKRQFKGWTTGLAALLLATVVQAQWHVDVSYDGKNGASNGTASQPFTSIAAGVAAANAGGSTTVLIADGTYRSGLNGGNETFGAAGIALTKSLTIRGGYVGQVTPGESAVDWTAETRVLRSTIIDLTAAGTRAFTASNSITLEGVTIRNASHTLNGGAIFRSGGHGDGATIRNCLFTNNVTSADGGAVHLHGRYGTVVIEDSDFINNTGRRGGAAHIDGSPSSDTRVSLFVRRSKFESNRATDYAGAIETPQGGPLMIEDCVFSGNEAGTHSGALRWASTSHAFTARRSIFAGNGSASGAAAVGTISRPTTYENCLFHGNAGPYTIEVTGGGLTVLHCTLAGNPNTVSALRVTQPLTVKNSIIVSNGLRGIQRTGTQLVDVDYNNVWGHSAGDYDGLSAGGNDISADPLFADAAGGDYRLAKGSPCVDAGANLGITTDLVGTPRPTRNGYDMGCYEESQVARVRNLAPVVGTTSVWLRGSLDFDAGGSCGVYFYWGSADGDTDKSGWTEIHVGDQNVGEFQTEITGLTPGAEYFFRALASNAYDEVWADATISFTTFSGSAVDRLWVGTGGNALASTAANWFGGTAPSGGDFIVLDSSPSNLTWDADAPQTVGNWTQTENYKGTVTFNTVYGSSGFTVFTVTGDATVMGGNWRHAGNGSAETYRLKAVVNGDFRLGPQASINVEGLGYGTSQGPGRGKRSSPSQGASHGGLGGLLSGTVQPTAYLVTYGSVTEPVNLGSGGNNGAGGGAVSLVVGGTAMIEGTISANAPTVSGETMGSGGSVYLRAGDVVSPGATISARGGVSTSGSGFSTGGGGGRIAMVLDSGTAIDPDLVFDARGGTGTQGNKSSASAGTIYLQTASQSAGGGTLVIDNFGVTTYGLTTTLQTPATDYSAFDAIIVRGRGRLGLDANDTFDFGAGALAGAGRDAAEVVIRSVGTLTFPSSFTISGYSLCADALANLTADLTVAADGRLTHSGHLAPHIFKLNLALTGSLTVQAGGEVSGQTRGYEPATGPGAGDRSDYGASYGGLGGVIRTDVLGNPSFQTYGSLLDPTDLGSGGNATPGGFGGGAVRLVVSGDVALDGSVNVLGQSETASGAGGSVSLTCRTLSGSGLIDASGPNSDSGSGDRVGGGGGRVAVKLTHGANVGGVTLRAFGSRVTSTTTRDGSAGTVYLETAGQMGGKGVITVRNTANHSVHASSFTPIPHRTAAFTDDLKKATLRIEERGRVGLMADTTVGDLVIVGNGYLQTGAFKLYVDAREHHLDDPSKRGTGDTAMVDNYANIVWTGKNPGTLILLR